MRRAITEFENAMLDKVRQAVGGQAPTVRLYHGELDHGAVRSGAVRFPAVFVLYSGRRVARNGRSRTETLGFSVLVAVASFAGDGKDGASQRAGALLDAIQDALDGALLFDDGHPVEFGGDQVAGLGNALVYVADYTARQTYHIQR